MGISKDESASDDAVGVAEHLDVAIVGGGPAGLTASIWLARYLHSVVVVDSGDPRNWETRGINGFLGHPNIRPAQLRGLGRDEARQSGVRLVDAVCERVTRHDDERFELTLADGKTLQARRLLLAIGLKDVWPDLPGLARVYGSTAHVCPDCDGYDCRRSEGRRDRLGTESRRAWRSTSRAWTRDIIICTNGEPANLDLPEYCDKLDALNIPVIEYPISCVDHSGSRVQSLTFESGLALDCDKIFFAIGQYPADDLGAQLGCERDAGGHIIVDEAYHTSVRNCFAAGDIVPGPQLAIAAASDGAIAALAIHKTLIPSGRKLEKLENATD